MTAPQPLAAPRRPPQGGPRLLLISHHFPPGQATGALRWQKLAALAAARGWGVDAVTVHPDSLASADFGRMAELPEGTRVFGARIPPDRVRRWEDAAHAALGRLRSRERGDGGPPTSTQATSAPAEADLAWRADLRWGAGPRSLLRAFRAWRAFAAEWAWAREAAEVALAVAAEGRHDAVVTCGPPHMVHLAGRRVAARTGLPLVMDLRDPWSLAPAVFRSVASPLWYALAERYEARAVGAAALVACNTGALTEAMAARHPSAAGRMVTVMNGCDDDDPLPARKEEGRFLVSYAGSIYIDRDPRPLLRAAARVVRGEGVGPERFGLEFVGHVDAFGGVPLRRLAADEGLDGYVEVVPRLPRAAALARLARASVLLSLPQGVDLAVPSKVFEYVRFPAWVLALAARGSATERLLRGSGADVVEPDDEGAMEEVMRTRFRAWARGERPRPLNADGRFGRARQADVLFGEMERRGIVRAARPGRAA